MPIPLIILEGKNDVVYYTAITLANLKVLEGKKTQIVEGVFMTVWRKPGFTWRCDGDQSYVSQVIWKLKWIL